MDYYLRLLEEKKKTFSIMEIKLIFKIENYIKFAETINELVLKNKLSPVKASGTNGRKDIPLFNKYKIVGVEKDYSETYEEIKLLSREFNHQAYMDKPEEYIKYREEIKALDEFFKRKRDELLVPAAINERSFQIWGREKLIKESPIPQRIFSFNDLNLSMLNFYETPEPFFEYIHSYSERMNILILENKDTWYTLRKIMREKGKTAYINSYNVLLYGEGKKIIRNNGMLGHYDREILNGSSNTFFYFGDLDFEGIGIYTSLKQLYPELDIKLDTGFYSLMLGLCDIDMLPAMKNDQQEVDIKSFLREFSTKEGEKIRMILNKGKYIPQEIINYKILNEIMN